MKILFDIGHPAHVHYFRNTIMQLMKGGHEVGITARDKDIALDLLDSYELDYLNRGKGANSLLGKLKYLPKANYQIYRYCKHLKPDLFIGFGSFYAAQVAWFMNRPSLIFDDTENAAFGQLFYRPFATNIFTPECFGKDFKKKQIKFNSYMELSYLHPNWFKPDPDIFKLLNLSEDESFVILRFVSWNANHDIGHQGVSLENKHKLVKKLSQYARVFITSENPLDSFLDSYRINIPADRIHDALFYAHLFYGESATMASEAAVLGTPAIYIDNIGRGYTTEEEKRYQLVKNFTESEEDQKKSIQTAVELLRKESDDLFYKKQRDRLLSEKIDITSYLIWIVTNYPQSVEILKKNPDYQYEFMN